MSTIPEVEAAAIPEPNWIGYAHGTGNNYDGDTLKVFTEIKTVRLLGVDTPERYAKNNELEREAGRIARWFVRDWLADADPKGDGFGLVINVKDKGKYGRNLTRVWRRDTGAELGRDLLAAGLARIYWGEKRREWDPEALRMMLVWENVNLELKARGEL